MFYQPNINYEPTEVLCYLRKSRSDDPLMSTSEVLAKHEEILDDWCQKNLGAPVPEKNKYREVVSGESLADRPEIQLVLKRMESPAIKAVLCVEPQRLTRGDLEDVGRIMKLFKYTNTLVITPQRVYDLHDDYDWDAFERELKRGNDYLAYTKKILARGRLLSVSQGHFIGSTPPYGYDKVWVTEGKNKYPTLAINPEQANVVQIMFDLYVRQDFGYIKIARALDDYGFAAPKGAHWSPAAIKDMLTNIHYIGKIKWNWRKTIPVVEDGEIVKTRPKSNDYEVFDGKHEAIISEELFQAAQKKMGRNSRGRIGLVPKNALAGILQCRCGRVMLYQSFNKNGKERSAPRLYCPNQSHCNTGSCTYDEMIDLVCDILKQNLEDFEIELDNNNDEVLKVHQKIIKNLEDKLADVEAREISLWESQAHPDPAQRMPEYIFKKLKNKLLEEKSETMSALENAKETMPKPREYEEKISRFHNALEALKDPEVDVAAKNALLKLCIDKIIYHRERPVRGSNTVSIASKKYWDTRPIKLEVKLWA